eukprot:256844-Pelagomonas_calceolata.AAC.2
MQRARPQAFVHLLTGALVHLLGCPGANTPCEAAGGCKCSREKGKKAEEEVAAGGVADAADEEKRRLQRGVADAAGEEVAAGGGCRCCAGLQGGGM